jgi:hypothetical protein
MLWTPTCPPFGIRGPIAGIGEGRRRTHALDNKIVTVQTIGTSQVAAYISKEKGGEDGGGRQGLRGLARPLTQRCADRQRSAHG